MKRVRTYCGQTKAAVNCLAVEIKIRRKQKGWTEQELADRAGVSRTTVQKVESGDMGCAIGLVFELATLVGLLLLEEAQNNSRSSEQILSLLPKRIRSQDRTIDDNF